jgi:hypothetical protein
VLTSETSVVGRSARAPSAKAPSRCARFDPVRELSDSRDCVAAPPTRHVNVVIFAALPLAPRCPPPFVSCFSPRCLFCRSLLASPQPSADANPPPPLADATKAHICQRTSRTSCSTPRSSGPFSGPCVSLDAYSWVWSYSLLFVCFPLSSFHPNFVVPFASSSSLPCYRTPNVTDTPSTLRLKI